MRSISLLVRILSLTAVFGTFVTPVSAQAPRPAVSPVRIEKIASTRLNETREVWVSLPDGYDETRDKYPVLTMFDGEMNFNSGVIGGLRQAASLGLLPDFIVVGVVNTDRSKDVFPEVVTYNDGTKGGGRADSFLDFVGEELLPLIEKTYRTEPLRVLYGTSNSGFTAVYALFRNPGLADVFIAASATLSIPILDHHRDAWLRDYKGGDRRLILVMGENDFPTIISKNGALKEQCDIVAPAGLTCRLAVLEGAGHVPADSLMKGLRLGFEGWKPQAPPKK